MIYSRFICGILIPRVVLWGLGVHPSSVFRDVGETVVTAHLSGRSGIYRLPACLTNTIRICSLL